MSKGDHKGLALLLGLGAPKGGSGKGGSDSEPDDEDGDDDEGERAAVTELAHAFGIHLRPEQADEAREALKNFLDICGYGRGSAESDHEYEDTPDGDDAGDGS